LQKVPGKIQEGKTKKQIKIKKSYEETKSKKENYYQDPKKIITKTQRKLLSRPK